MPLLFLALYLKRLLGKSNDAWYQFVAEPTLEKMPEITNVQAVPRLYRQIETVMPVYINCT